MSLSAEIRVQARALGFERVGILPVGPSLTHAFYREWLARGFAGEMAYLHRHAEAKADPARWAPGVRSIICLACNYSPGSPEPAPEPGKEPRGRVSRYARGRDYHEVLQERLAKLAAFIEARAGCAVLHRAAVDTAPVMEREWAARAGLGWVGKNALLIDRRLGSWLFLAELLVGLELDPLDPDEGQPSRPLAAPSGPGALALPESCGSCTACLEACPTGAIVAEKTVDARRCLSYLTIELKGPIPEELRPHLDDWIFGCDICQEVCPWNRRAPATREPAFDGDDEAATPSLIDLLALDEAAFRERYRHTPLWRARRRGLLRNAAIALGNAAARAGAADGTDGPGRAADVVWREEVLRALAAALEDREPLVRGAAAWALGRWGGEVAIRALQARLGREADPGAAGEVRRALARCEGETLGQAR